MYKGIVYFFSICHKKFQTRVSLLSGLFKGKIESGSLVDYASYIYRLVMSLYNMLHDGKAQAGSTLLARPRFIDPVKTFKNPGQVLFVDSNAVVGNFNHNIVFQIVK